MNIQITEDKFIPKLLVDICCNQDVNGEHRLLEQIIKESETESVIFDVGARNSKFPEYSNTHQFHLFDPTFIYEDGVNYDKPNVLINENALNSTDYTIDNYCKINNIENIEYLKIDTDGYDIDVLKGAKKMIQQTKYIQIEHDIFHLFHKINLDELYEILDGFNIYKITAFGLERVDKIKENYIYSNYLFTKSEINYEPHVLDCDFFIKTFWESSPSEVTRWFNTTSGPFSYKENKNFDTTAFVSRYFSQYLPSFIDGLPT